MSRIDETKPFLSVNIAVLTVSDSRSLENDVSGKTLVDRIEGAGHKVVARTILPDDTNLLVDQLQRWIADTEVDAIITTGGTGVTGRDITPEVFHQLYDKELTGFGELFRQISYPKIGTSAMQSRATGGVAHGTYMFALPGSPNACKDAWDEILKFQLDSRHMPCNLVELMPRLLEHLKPHGHDH